MAVADSLQHVVDDVWIWHAFDPRVKTELFSTVIRAAHGWVVLDPIDLTESAWGTLTRLGPVAAIVLTNGNHCRASVRFRQRLGAGIFAHPDAVGELECPVDATLREGNRVGGSLEWIELRGAGPGEVALFDDRGRLHVGDALVNLESTGFVLLPEKYCLDAVQLRQSLRLLKGRRVEWMTFAHGLPLREGAQSRLDGLLAGCGLAN